MSEFIIARIDPLPDERDRMEKWLIESHVPSVASVPGLDATPVVYAARHV